MARNRNSATRASDRLQVARMLLEGQSIRAIADALGRSTATVQSDVNELRREWSKSAKASMRDHLATVLAKFSYVEQNMFQELARIQDPLERLNAFEKIGKLVARRADVLNLRSLADVSKLEAEMQEAWLEIRQRLHFALNQVFGGDRDAYGEFLNAFNDYDPVAVKKKALAEVGPDQ